MYELGVLMTVRRLTSVTTKVRRVGYFVLISNLLKSTGPLSNILLIEKLEKSANSNRDNLIQYCYNIGYGQKSLKNPPGEIAGKQYKHIKQDAAKRYIKTCEEIGLITKIAGSYQNTRVGNVLLSIKGNPNPFNLSLMQICFLLKIFLVKDYDYLKTLMELKGENKEDNWTAFQEIILSRWMKKIATTDSPYEIERLKKTLDSVSRWGQKGKGEKSAERYYRENIKATRMEWLIDLKILEPKITKSNFDTRYKNLFCNEFINNHWLNNEYYGAFNESYKYFKKEKTRHWTNIAEKEKVKILKKYIDNCYNLLGRKELKRLSASQLFEYTLCNLLYEERIVSSYNLLEESIAEFFPKYKMNYKYIKTLSKEDIGHIIKLK